VKYAPMAIGPQPVDLFQNQGRFGAKSCILLGFAIENPCIPGEF